MIKVFKNFLDENDRTSLCNWAIDNYKKDFFVTQKMNIKQLPTRKSTRSIGAQESLVQYPEIAYKIQNKIINFFNLKNFKYPPVFKDGIVCGVGESKDSVYLHKDPIHYKNTYTLHANFIVQKPNSGGITIIDGKRYDIDEKDLLLFIPSHLHHEVDESGGEIKRILWCYGFCIDKNTVERIFQ